MRKQLRNYLFQNKIREKVNYKFYLLITCSLFVLQLKSQQIINYVNNGGFENLKDCIPFPQNNKIKHWSGIDTSKFLYAIYNKCLNNVPGASSADFQFPRSGNGYVGGTFLCINCNTITNRSYFRNELKGNLQSNVTYCVKFYVNIRNYSTFGIDAIGAYLGDNNLDTIKYGNIRISYLNPQIQNPASQVFLDTLHWKLITGFITAAGNESSLVIGNFKTDAMTNITQISTTVADTGCDLLIDDVSIIDVDLPAFAGNDNSVIAGDSIYIGRESDVGIDEACMWYKLPTIITPTTPAIDTIAGFWIKPITTETYVVRQEVCGNVKWDTVVIYMNPVGVEKLKLLNEELKIYPVPANDFIELKISNMELLKDFKSAMIYNNLGKIIREEVLRQAQQPDGTFKIKTNDLQEGVYSLQFRGDEGTVSKRFVVSH